MRCRQLVQLVSDYLDGALLDAEHEVFERHLAVCGPCREYVKQLRETIALN